MKHRLTEKDVVLLGIGVIVACILVAVLAQNRTLFTVVSACCLVFVTGIYSVRWWRRKTARSVHRS